MVITVLLDIHFAVASPLRNNTWQCRSTAEMSVAEMKRMKSRKMSSRLVLVMASGSWLCLPPFCACLPHREPYRVPNYSLRTTLYCTSYLIDHVHSISVLFDCAAVEICLVDRQDTRPDKEQKLVEDPLIN